MGTDAALDICQALPLGVPKYVVSTVAFSPLIEPQRLSADIQMILWAGGLYGLNSVCKSSLSQAAGAVLGAARAVEPPSKERPIVGMTSLGSSCLNYMKPLKPELEMRGYEVAIFHATGMGGMAYENIAREGGFACVMDFALPELGNLLAGSVVNAGDDHAHNRLIKSSGLNAEERRETAREMAKRLRASDTPAHVILTTGGIEEWDREGQEAHDPEAFAEFCDEMRRQMTDPILFTELNCHINDQAFVDTVLKVFDGWVEDGTIKNSGTTRT